MAQRSKDTNNPSSNYPPPTLQRTRLPKRIQTVKMRVAAPMRDYLRPFSFSARSNTKKPPNIKPSLPNLKCFVGHVRFSHRPNIHTLLSSSNGAMRPSHLKCASRINAFECQTLVLVRRRTSSVEVHQLAVLDFYSHKSWNFEWVIGPVLSIKLALEGILGWRDNHMRDGAKWHVFIAFTTVASVGFKRLSKWVGL